MTGFRGRDIAVKHSQRVTDLEKRETQRYGWIKIGVCDL